MAEEPQINCWEDFRAYVIRSDIRFVRPDYILRLRREGRVFPRRQEAEGEEDALFQLGPATQAGDFKYVAVSHCWESREHPDPHGFQLKLLSTWIVSSGSRAQDAVFFIDYVSLYQFGNRTETQDASFRRSMEHMHLLYANSGADFCQGVLSISSLTPWWWKTDRSKAIPVFSNPAGRVQEVPLANLRPTLEGSCSEECDDSCANLHANSTPYWHRGWCRAEVEWASPAIQDISFLRLWTCVTIVVLIIGGSIWAGLTLRLVISSRFANVYELKWKSIGLQLGALVFVLPCLQNMHVRVRCATRRNPGTNAFWSRSRLALSAEEFQEQVRTKGVAFTHRSDVSQVVALQEKVYKQKLVATKRMFLTRLARGDRQKLPSILLENQVLTELVLSATFLNVADIVALASVLRAKELENLQLQSVPLCYLSLRHLCRALRPQLRVLALSWCSLCDNDMPLLAECLSRFPLEELVLSYNKINNNGAMTLASSLRSHPTLKCLDLSGNGLGHVGASALADALMHNWNMEKLILKGTLVRACRLPHRPHQEIQLRYDLHARFLFGMFGMLWMLPTSAGYVMEVQRTTDIPLVFPPIWALLCAYALFMYICRIICPSLLLQNINSWGYMCEVVSQLPDWSLLFYDWLESPWEPPARLWPAGVFLGDSRRRPGEQQLRSD